MSENEMPTLMDGATGGSEIETGPSLVRRVRNASRLRISSSVAFTAGMRDFGWWVSSTTCAFDRKWKVPSSACNCKS